MKKGIIAVSVLCLAILLVEGLGGLPWSGGQKRTDLDLVRVGYHTNYGGSSAMAVGQAQGYFEQEGIQVETVQVGNKAIRGCVACLSCMEKGKCVFDDLVNETAPKFAEADGLVIASPVYYASANGTLISFIDRLFYSTPFDKTMKVGAAVAVARRGGVSATYDELNKYFAISGMPIATGQYWNAVYGREKGEAAQDEEGMQTMRTLARNMVFLMRSIALGKEQYGVPQREPFQRTNFIR